MANSCLHSFSSMSFVQLETKQLIEKTISGIQIVFKQAEILG
jgi:hypothetical protein